MSRSRSRNGSRKIIRILFIVLIGITFIPVTYAASPSAHIFIDGEQKHFTQPPVVVNNVTLVPFRGIFEVFGTTVEWSGEMKAITALYEDIEIKLVIDSEFAIINGVKTKLDQPAIIKNGSTMVPLRFVSEALGGHVKWEQGTRSVFIESPKQDNETLTGEEPLITEKEDSSIKENSSVAKWEQAVIDLVNKERAQHDLDPLEMYEELVEVARLKSTDMRDQEYFSHDSPTYGTPFEMIKQFGITYTAAGENIAAGQETPEAVMEAWMNSPGHKENILNPIFTHIGVGYAEGGNYTHYWTQQFAKLD